MRGEGFADWFSDFDNTPSTVSIIPDDANDVMHAGDANQGAENCREGVTGSEQNARAEREGNWRTVTKRNCLKLWETKRN